MITFLKGFGFRPCNCQTQTQLQNYRAKRTLEIIKPSGFQTHIAVGCSVQAKSYQVIQN